MPRSRTHWLRPRRRPPRAGRSPPCRRACGPSRLERGVSSAKAAYVGLGVLVLAHGFRIIFLLSGAERVENRRAELVRGFLERSVVVQVGAETVFLRRVLLLRHRRQDAPRES